MFSAMMTLTTPDNTGASRVAFGYARSILSQGGRVLMMHGKEEQDEKRASLLKSMRKVGIETVCEPRLAKPIGRQLIDDLAERVHTGRLDCVIGNNQRDRAVSVHVAKQARVPSVICGHNQHVFRGRWPLPALKRAYYVRAMRKADLVICSSRQVLHEYVHDFGVDSRKCKLMPHGISLERKCQDTAAELQQTRESLGVKREHYMLSNVGRIDPQKGQDILLGAMRHLPSSVSAKLVIVGTVSRDVNEADNLKLESRLRKLASELGDRVVFAGWRDDFQRILKASDAYVHSSRWEGLPLTVLEALALRVPTITPDNSARPPGFEHGVHGLLVEPENEESLATAIVELVNSTTDQKREMARNGYELVESDFNMRRIGQDFVKVVNDAIAEFKKSAKARKELVGT